jgi:hypothetical protein
MERKTKNVKHFRVFGSKCYIKREDGRLGKFDSRVDKGILVGYSRKKKHINASVQDSTKSWKASM